MRIRLPFAFAFLLILLLASSAGLLPHSALPSTPAAAAPYIPSQSDKALHFLTFFALTGSFYFILDTTRRRVLNITLVVCTLILGVGSEVAQGLLPNDREFDAWHVLANVIGSLCALGLAGSYHRRSAERRRRAKYSALTGEGLEDEGEDLELGEGPGLVGTQQDEESAVPIDGPGAKRASVPSSVPTQTQTQKVEEELDNWDENQPDDWDAEDDDDTMNNGGTNAKMTPATSSADSSEEPRKKVAVD